MPWRARALHLVGGVDPCHGYHLIRVTLGGLRGLFEPTARTQPEVRKLKKQSYFECDLPYVLILLHTMQCRHRAHGWSTPV